MAIRSPAKPFFSNSACRGIEKALAMSSTCSTALTRAPGFMTTGAERSSIAVTPKY